MTQRNSYETPRNRFRKGARNTGRPQRASPPDVSSPWPQRSRQRECRMKLAVAVGLLILLAVPETGETA